MEKTRVGILGVGHLGKLHASLYKEIKAAEIVGIYDTDNEKAQKIGKELGLSAYSNVHELLDRVDEKQVGS